MKVEEGFQQAGIPPSHPYLDDPVLPSLFKRQLPPGVFRTLEADLVSLGDELIRDIRPLAPSVTPPTLVQYNEWGQRIDDLRVSEGWKKLTAFTVKHGVMNISHTRPYAEHSRTYGFAKMVLMVGDTHVIFCPFSMTDGAARVIELHGTDAMKREIHPHLISTDPAAAYTSGQWMTERPGGSDLSLTETTATLAPDTLPTDLGRPYLLSGFKWFASAADGNLALALARTSGPGTRGLSLFAVPLRMPPYASPLANNVRVHRLKNKLGTRAVPTAELDLDHARAWMVGEEGKGVKTIAEMLNITRVHSAVHSLGALARALSIARAHANVRAIDGGRQLLAENALHVQTLAGVAVTYRGLAHLVFGAVGLLGASETGKAGETEKLRLRMLTPVVKAFLAMRAVPAMEECMATLGGMGYMEEVGIGRLIQDALVEKIWEGTVNVLALDMLRAARAPGAIEVFSQWCNGVLDAARSLPLVTEVQALRSATAFAPAVLASPNPVIPRATLLFIGTLVTTLNLLEHATWAITQGEPSKDADCEAVRRWAGSKELGRAFREVADVLRMDEGEVQRAIEADQAMVYGPDARAKSKL